MSLGSVLIVEAAETAWLHSPFTIIVRTNSDDSSVDGTTDTVDLLIVELWDSIVLKCSVVTEIVHDRGINDVTDLEPLDGLVLGYKLMAIVAVEPADMSAASLGSSMVSALDWHFVLEAKTREGSNSGIKWFLKQNSRFIHFEVR